MDPKMDSGMNSGEVYSLEERIEMGTLPNTFSIAECIGIMDRLLCCEVFLLFLALKILIL
jgi:hypothetical protein